MKNKTLVFPLQKKYIRHAEDVKRAGNACLFILGKEGAEVDIYLIDEKRMRELNKKFREQDEPTNVLSFEEPKNFPRPRSRAGKRGSAKLGEIYLAPDYIERKKENMEHLVIHGMLHLLGYTHKGLRDRIEMEKKEKYVQNINLPRHRLSQHKRDSNGKGKRRGHNVRLGI